MNVTNSSTTNTSNTSNTSNTNNNSSSSSSSNSNSNGRLSHCTNCGLSGHIFRHCLSPVTSYGLIAIRYLQDKHSKSLFSKSVQINNGSDNIQYLLIQRKDSLSFIEFIRGKYNPADEDYIVRLINGMTQTEQALLLIKSFEELWCGVWGENIENSIVKASKTHKNDYDSSAKKFIQIKPKLTKLLHENPSRWIEPEWGFPKGRRNPYESDINCAIREFQEETALKRSDFTVIQNTAPISETFFGSNHVHYCHKYYIAVCNKDVEVKMNLEHPMMSKEIGGIQWCSLDEAISKIRPDNVEKREILLKAGKIMRNFHPVQTNEMMRYR
jgi:8-oxo-dGTP pyrophosphatase MutT (NUDIX family)